MSTGSIDGVLGCIRALREAEAHIRATAYDFSGGEREHHLQAADKAKRALAALTNQLRTTDGEPAGLTSE